MFGFVKPFVPNLRVKENELYKSIYCGLCRSMKKHAGGISRLTLSYDMTFFAMIRLAISHEAYGIEKRTCPVHPLKKIPMMQDNASLRYAALVGAHLAWYKMQDTIADEHGAKKLAARMASPFSGGLRRAGKKIEEPALLIQQAMAELSALEAAHCAVPDEVADVFGKLLGELLAYGFSGADARIAYEIGLHVGRFVYLADAICDFGDDKKRGSYNPFLYAYETEEQMEAFLRDAKDGVLAFELAASARAVDLIDFTGQGMLRACIENIITDGMQSALMLAEQKQ